MRFNLLAFSYFLLPSASALTVEGYLSFITKPMIWPYWSVFQTTQREQFGIVNTLFSSSVFLSTCHWYQAIADILFSFLFFSVSCHVCEHLHKPMPLESGGSQCTKAWSFSVDAFYAVSELIWATEKMVLNKQSLCRFFCALQTSLQSDLWGLFICF